MDKTISITIGNGIFTIREDAYEALKRYLDGVEASFGADEDGKDILADIEERIAELFREALKGKTVAVDVGMVERVIETIGRPEDLQDGDAVNDERPHATKRLYRDAENAVVAGVCAGIANYLGVDRTVVRLLFALAVVTGAFAAPAIIAYVIMWAVVPEAKSVSERMAMRGEPATLAHIGEQVKESVERGAERVKTTLQRDGEGGMRKIGTFLDGVFNVLGMVFWRIVAVARVFVRVLAGVIASVVMLASLAGLAGAMFLLTLLVAYPDSEIVDFPLEVIGFGPEYYLLVLSAFVVVAVPLTALFSSALGALRRRGVMSVATAVSLVFLWIVCASIAVATALHVLPQVRDAVEGETVTNVADLQRVDRRIPFGPMDDLRIGSGIEAEVVLGEINEVLLEGPKKDVEEIRLDEVGGRLTVRRDRNFVFCVFCVRSDVRAVVTVTEWPERYTAYGTAKLEASDVSTARIYAEASGASWLTLSGGFEEAVMAVSGASHVQLSGDSGRTLDAEASGASHVDALRYPVTDARFAVSGASRVKADVSGTVEGWASGASEITYRGGAVHDVSMSGSSNVRPLLVADDDESQE